MVSVIIPIYNVERYLKQCLKSVLNQTYRDMEIILVNDASPDGSLTICKQFAERDPRIRIIDKKTNEGVDLARFNGLDAAQGEYIYFIDPDDWLARRDIIELMVNKADETGVDYVMMNYQRVIGSHALIKTKCQPVKPGLIEKKELRDNFYLGYFGWPTLTPNMWDKLFRKSFLIQSGAKPTGLKYSQDTAFNLLILPKLEKIYGLEVNGYYYRFGGRTGKFKTDWLTAQKRLYQLRLDEAAKNDFPAGNYQARLQLLAVVESISAGALASFSIDKSRKMLEEELADSFWDDVLQPGKYPDMFQTPFMQALAARDVDKMIELSLPAAKRQRRMARVKKIANAILSRI